MSNESVSSSGANNASPRAIRNDLSCQPDFNEVDAGTTQAKKKKFVRIVGVVTVDSPSQLQASAQVKHIPIIVPYHETPDDDEKHDPNRPDEGDDDDADGEDE